jgi:hypothetical protein
MESLLLGSSLRTGQSALVAVVRRVLAFLLPVLMLAFLPGAARADGSGLAQLASPPAARSSVTVVVWPRTGLFGYVTSSNPGRCANHRQVIVYKPTESGGLRRIGSARATLHGGAFQWRLRTNEAGSVVVVMTAGKRGCQTSSKRLTVLLRGKDEIPDCPSTASVCQLKLIDLDKKTGSLFSTPMSEVVGVNTVYGPAPWCCWDIALISSDNPSTPYNQYPWRFAYLAERYTEAMGRYEITALLRGTLPSSNSDRWTITDATAPAWHLSAGVSWRTPDLPGAPAGSNGGPLYINYQPGTFGFDVFIGGYLYRK